MFKKNKFFNENTNKKNSENNLESILPSKFIELIKSNNIDGYRQWIDGFSKENQPQQIQKLLFSLCHHFKNNSHVLLQLSHLQILSFYSMVFSDFIHKARDNQTSINQGMLFWALKSVADLYEILHNAAKASENLSYQQRLSISIHCNEIDCLINLLEKTNLPCKKWIQISQCLVTLGRYNCLQGQFKEFNKVLSSLNNNAKQEEFNDAIGYILINTGLIQRQNRLAQGTKLDNLSKLLTVSERTANVTELLRIYYGLSLCTDLIPQGGINNEFVFNTLKLFDSERRYLLSVNESVLLIKNIGKLIDAECLGMNTYQLIPDISRLLDNALQGATLGNADGCDAIEGLTLILLSAKDVFLEKLLLELIASLKLQQLKPIEAGKVLKSICLLKLSIEDKVFKTLEQCFAEQANTMTNDWQKDLHSKVNKYFQQNNINGHCSIETVIGAWHVDFLVEMSGKKIIFELDGRHHYIRSETNDSDALRLRKQDQRRDEWLMDHGYRVERIKNNDGKALQKIIGVISESLSLEVEPKANSSKLKP